MSRWWGIVAVVCGCLTSGGCASTVPYQPKERILEEMPVEDARARLAETIERAVEPPILSVDVGRDTLVVTHRQVIHGPFGIPVGSVERTRTLPYVQIRRVDLYDNHWAYVHGERLMTKLLFDDAGDARSFADLLMSFKRYRLFGDGRPRD